MSTLTGTTLYLKQTEASTFQYSTNNSTWLSASFPITLGTADATLTFVTDLSFIFIALKNYYFILGANGQTIDGNNKTITINANSSATRGFRGLVKNGGYSYSGNVIQGVTGRSNTTVKNIKLVSYTYIAAFAATSTDTTSSVKVGSGWIGQL